jgi:hypothetical protein
MEVVGSKSLILYMYLQITFSENGWGWGELCNVLFEKCKKERVTGA